MSAPEGSLYTSDYLSSVLEQIDSEFRENFSSIIIKMKFKTHTCQAECYKDPDSLKASELCARKCFTPLLMAKVNIGNLMNQQKEKLEECKVKSESTNSGVSSRNRAMKHCYARYQKDLEGIREEVEYIYNGYSKNLI